MPAWTFHKNPKSLLRLCENYTNPSWKIHAHEEVQILHEVHCDTYLESDIDYKKWNKLLDDIKFRLENIPFKSKNHGQEKDVYILKGLGPLHTWQQVVRHNNDENKANREFLVSLILCQKKYTN